jgi:O-antigen/teichoic acid export membrane protein
MANSRARLVELLQQRKGALRSGLGILVSTGISTLAGFGLSILLARELGAEQFGLYSFIIGIVGLLLITVQSGLPLLMTREIASLRVDGVAQELRRFLKWAFTVLLASILLVACAVYIWLAFADGSDGSSASVRFFWPIALLLAFWGFTNFCGAIVKGFERPLRSSIPNSVVRPLALLALAAVFLSLDAKHSAREIVLAHGLATILSSTVAVVFAASAWRSFGKRKAHDPEKRPENGPENDKSTKTATQWLLSLGTLSLVSGVAIINNRIDIIMVGSLSSLSQVAYYNIAMQLTALIAMGQIGVNAILAPKAARMFRTGDEETLGQIVSLTCLVTGAIGLVIFLALATLGQPILEAAFGAEFLAAYMPMLVMAIGALLAVASGPVVLLLNMAGHERVSLITTVTMLAGKVALNFVLIPAQGALGAAFATAIALTMLNLTLTFVLWRLTAIRSGILLLMPRIGNQR